MADWPVKSLGDKTLLQYAKTPYMDKLARMGRNGRLITVAEGFHPGSEVANMSVLGYNLPKVYEGRGPLEAASIGVDLKPGEMAMRCNLICVEGDILKNHSSGHISTEEADVLIQYLQEKLGNDRVRFHTGVQYRHLLVIKGGNKELDCTPPHDVPLKPFRPLMVKPLVPEAQETADLINDLILKSQELLKNHPLKGVYQMLKLIVICIGVIIIISTLIDKDPMNILTGLGASAAILMLVFKDTIMGLVAGVQLSANNMLRPGDWITMPKYGADGTVIEVTLTTVKVQNWDNTITTIPPYALVSDSFQNWRGMRESGGRRIKRSLNIDMTTVHFCTPQQLKNFEKRGWLEGFERTGKEEVNLHVFRHYLERYLRHHPRVNTSLTLMVRQLQPTPQGLPIELYFFSANKDWIPYERLQAEVFDHVLAVLPQFGLKVFQSPTGTDILALSKQ